ncbi:hypothetical protein FQA39_LY17809 [Lamprigera yunnana]|nr:hypothetical protein FQA39_LY17809 [Lamprigera yunnana]
MKPYYTVQQCEKFRDKYKIGRKVRRQFLKGNTCSQCLVKRISDIGLQHFLDTISKYIKDCSDSDTSSYLFDEEECKEAVEQNGEDSKTTIEEESKKSEGGRNTKPVSYFEKRCRNCLYENLTQTMKPYYTVQQCEKFRDKYKIGRKVRRQFLKGNTCSQCLVKRISDIGLQHFLDTISKYIKDCSDSDTSSYLFDEEECKEAVEQNGEDSKTTIEEESKKSEGGRNTKPVS